MSVCLSMCVLLLNSLTLYQGVDKLRANSGMNEITIYDKLTATYLRGKMCVRVYACLCVAGLHMYMWRLGNSPEHWSLGTFHFLIAIVSPIDMEHCQVGLTRWPVNSREPIASACCPNIASV